MPGLRKIIKVSRNRHLASKTSKETIYYLSSEEYNEISYFARRIHAHWSIENKLYGYLDVTFRKGQCRIRIGNEAINFSAMRKYTLEMLKRQNEKLSLKRWHNKCMLNLDYLTQILKAC